VDGLTIEKAIALAGGYTERAAKNDVTIVREGAPGNRLREAPTATPIRAGDVITIEESFF
jgi:polysaccharide export outer membrane protein